MPPTRASAKIIRTPAPSRRRRRLRGGRGAASRANTPREALAPRRAGRSGGAAVMASPWSIRRRTWVRSPQDVDHEEQGHPDDVDEVPVVRHHDRGGGLCRGEAAHGGADQVEDEGDQPTRDVQPVEAGGEVEHRPVPVLVDLDVLADQRSEEHTSELQSLAYLVCRLL